MVINGKKNKLSFSSVNKYLQCPRLYREHYVNKLRGKTTSGALLIGSAIDKAINELLVSKDLEKSIKVFDSEFEYGFINNKRIHLPESELITYAKKDFDEELLNQDDINTLEAKCSDTNPLEVFNDILKQKEENGFENLAASNKQFYNLTNWLCLKRKAHIMLKAYQEKVLPKIKSVIDIQKRILVTGKTGDEIECYIDLIVEWEDGKKYVIDNKTSSVDYEEDSASKSQQLIMYYYACNKEGLNLDGVGFAVMYKQIQKNRIKICKRCNHNGTGKTHKTCNNMIDPNPDATWEEIRSSITAPSYRCNGEWKETISPECKIDIILNEVTVPAQNLIIQAFIGANEGIKTGIFPPNVDSCMKYGNKCVMYEKCWSGKDDNLITLEAKDEKK